MNARPKVLKDAASLIRNEGLVKQRYTDGVRHCTVGALQQVLGGLKDTKLSDIKPEGKLLADMLGLSDWVRVMTWNDEPERTAEDVATLLEQAAEKAAAAEGVG